MIMKKLLFGVLFIFSTSVLSANVDLCNELTLDPLGRGYSGMSDTEKLADITAAYRSVFHERVEGADLFEGVEPADWAAIAEAERTQVLSLLSFGEVRPTGNVRTFLINIFGGGSATISNMAAIATHNISRAEELGLGSLRAVDIVGACGG